MLGASQSTATTMMFSLDTVTTLLAIAVQFIGIMKALGSFRIKLERRLTLIEADNMHIKRKLGIGNRKEDLGGAEDE